MKIVLWAIVFICCAAVGMALLMLGIIKIMEAVSVLHGQQDKEIGWMGNLTRIDMDDVIADAKQQKRITNGYLRKRWNVSEEEAEMLYTWLKNAGVVYGMGYVVEAGR